MTGGMFGDWMLQEKMIKNMLDTNLSVEEIELAIYDSYLFNNKTDLFVPNVSYGLLNHEADMIIMSKSGYLTEIEIKRSFSDFKADFKKKHNHLDPCIENFYYLVPISIKDKVMEVLYEKFPDYKEKPWVMPGVLVYDEEGVIDKVKESGTGYRSNARKLFLEEKFTLARLGCYRYWNKKKQLLLLEKKINKKKDEDDKRELLS